MLKRVCLFIVTLSSLVVLGLPIAQAQSGSGLRAHVPFDFYVRDHLMPAGAYTIRAVSDGSATLIIRNADGRDAVVVLTSGAEAKGRQPDNARLIFKRYGDQYFLAAAWQDAHEGRAIIPSRRERGLRQELALSGQAAEPETISIVASLTGN